MVFSPLFSHMVCLLHLNQAKRKKYFHSQIFSPDVFRIYFAACKQFDLCVFSITEYLQRIITVYIVDPYGLETFLIYHLY